MGKNIARYPGLSGAGLAHQTLRLEDVLSDDPEDPSKRSAVLT
jgi:hypothetical protein